MIMTVEKGKYQLIGTGHSQCFTGILEEWWTKESFTNVVFFCKTAGQKGSFQLRANASVLAAASPFFKTLLRDAPPEEDIVVYLPDYSSGTLSCVLQYIYTGSLKLRMREAQATEIQALLKELQLRNENQTSNYSTGDSLLLRVRFRQKGETSSSTSVIKKTVQVEFQNRGDTPSLPRVSPRASTVRSVNQVNRMGQTKERVPAKKCVAGIYENNIDCAVTDPDRVRLEIPLPDTEGGSLGSVEKHAVVQETLKPSLNKSTGVALSQCFARESRHRLLVKEYIEPLAPFEYDPSPLYMQKVPLKQYKRKTSNPEKNEMAVVEERPKLSGSKVHVSGAGETVLLTKDSIFADTEDFPVTKGEAERRSVEKPKSSGSKTVLREMKQTKKEALADLAKAEEWLEQERKKRNRLTRMARRIEEKIQLMKKRLTFRRDHSKVKEKPKEKPEVLVPCETCGKMIKEYWLKKHRKQHEAHQFCCDKCGRTFALRSRLTSHYQLQHVDIAETGGFPCDVCGHVFKAKKYLTRHMTLHTGEKRYACKYCEKRFRTEKVRDNHQRTHTGEKPFVCHICQKPFSQKFNLSVHVKTHDHPRRWRGTPSEKLLPTFQCPHCPAKFRWETYLKTHMAKHTGESPSLPCELCEQVFTSFNQLRNHRKEAHPSKTILCDTCGKQFISKGCYYRHRRKHFKTKDSRVNGSDDPQEEQPCEVVSELLIEEA